MPKKKNPVIPPLRHGEGTMYLTSSGTIEYKKILVRGDGVKIRKTVHGATANEAFKKMKEAEETLKKGFHPKEKTPLIDEMYYWLNNVKKPQLREQSFNRLEGTIKNRIGTSELKKYRYHSISEEELRSYLLSLNNGELSYSEIKKTYDCLNAFYRYVSERDGFDNPMKLIECIREENVLKETKTVVYYDEEDIKHFIEESKVLWKSSGNLRFKYGPVIAANIYLGLRIGELLALTWADVDLKNNKVYVNKTQIERRPDKQKGTKGCFIVQPYTKSKNGYRTVPINAAAKSLLEFYLLHDQHKNPNDYVLSTRNGKMTTAKNIQDSIRSIVQTFNKSAKSSDKIKVLDSNTHFLRHTCASLYFRAEVHPTIIARILGNTEDVLKKTYIHLWPDQIDEASIKIMDSVNLI